MHEPAVTLTDFALALECGVFAFLLVRRRSGGALRFSFSVFFAALGLASLLGALVHGFLPDAGEGVHRVLWRMTLLALGIAALAAWRIGARVAFRERLARAISLVAAATFGAYSLVVLVGNDRFQVAVVYYVPAALFLLVCLAAEARRRPVPRLMGIGLHPVIFDANALYHALDMIALLLVYQGSRALLDARPLSVEGAEPSDP